MKKIVAGVACVAFVWVALAEVDAAQGGAADTKASAQQSSKVVSLTGTVLKSADGLLLKTPKASYVLAGRDLSAYVGKKVTVAGTVAPPASKGGKKVFHVTQVK